MGGDIRINTSAVFTDAEDALILENDKPVEVLTLLKRVILADRNPDGSPIAGDEKYNRFELYMKLRSAGSDTDFSTEEIQLLEKAVKVYPTLIAGQLIYLLHNKPVNT